MQTNNTTRKQEVKASVQELASRAASRVKAVAAEKITPPNSAYQFEAISPSALPQIFKNALTVPILLDIIKCVATFFVKIGQDPKPVMRDTYNMFKGGGDPEKFIRLESRKTSHFCASPDIFSCGGVGCGDGGGSGGFGGGGGSGGGGGGVAAAVAVEVVNVVVQVVELDVEVEEASQKLDFTWVRKAWSFPASQVGPNVLSRLGKSSNGCVGYVVWEDTNGAAVTSGTEISEVQQTLVKEGVTKVEVSKHRVFLLGENRWKVSFGLSRNQKNVGESKTVNTTTRCVTCRGEGRLLCADVVKIWDEVLDNEATPIEYAEKLDNLHTKYCPKQCKAQQVSTLPSSTSCIVNSSCKILKCSNNRSESQMISWTTFLSIYRDVKKCACERPCFGRVDIAYSCSVIFIEVQRLWWR
ncbi:unnamed protein product [Prunus armeniaca]